MVVPVTECMDTLLPHSWQVMFHILIALLSASAVGMPVLQGEELAPVLEHEAKAVR